MTLSTLIRSYTAADKERVLQLFRLNTPLYFSPEEESDLVHYLDHEIEMYFVLEYNNQVMACGGINFSEDKTKGIISWDMVHPDVQGKSLGRHLLRHRIAVLQNIDHIQTIVVRTSQHVFRFYEKQGFQLIEVVKDYWAKGFDLYRMEYVAQSLIEA